MKYNTILNEERNTVNHEGEKSYRLSPEMELYTAVVTASLSAFAYEKTNQRVERIVMLAERVSPLFLAQLAVYTRTVMHLRSVPLLLLVELARLHNGDNLVARAVEQTVQRADEIMELLMCYQWRNADSSNPSPKRLNHLSRQIQNGLQRAFNHFDEYQFAKYNRNGNVTLRDALFLVHPKAKDEAQQRLFDKIASRSLSVPYTWETELSALGSQKFKSAKERQQAFSAKWEELIRSHKVGYMALMRNLRNMLSFGVSDDAMRQVCDFLSDPVQVTNAKQLPFRYLAAYREVEQLQDANTGMVLSSLEAAMRVSAVNIEGFDDATRVLLACDVSGSMYSPVSKNSTVRLFDIGLVLAMLMRSRCRHVVSGIFGDSWKQINMPAENILANVKHMMSMNGKVGFGTNGYAVIDWMISKNIIMDKVMMFTDVQMWDSKSRQNHIEKSWHRYKQIAPEAKLYLFDLAGYGNTPLDVAEPDVFLIAGWSDRIFDVLTALEKGEDTLGVIKQINV